jgi:hypothetical protein
MKNINVKGIFVAGALAAVTFLILEIIIETAFSKLFNLSESIYFEQLGIYPGGAQFYIINLIIFIIEMILIMTIYALIRNRFNSNISAGLITSGIFLALGFLILANFTNLGILTFGMGFTSFVFNVFELPPAVLVGAVFYGEG